MLKNAQQSFLSEDTVHVAVYVKRAYSYLMSRKMFYSMKSMKIGCFVSGSLQLSKMRDSTAF